MRKYVFPFEKLTMWERSVELVTEIYAVTRSFPKEELFGITSQIRRCAVSVASNIAEGATRVSPKDRANFSVIAYSSLMELINQLVISKKLGFLQEEEYEALREKVAEISRMLIAFRNSQKAPN
ncbi:MAG: four helix bundle protein [Saprospiraceae bacterium]